jgi:hypothetical protein
MHPADRLSWTIARSVAGMPQGTIFAASACAVAGIRLSQEMLGCRLYLCGRGGAYDLRGILALHARHWLFNRRPHAHVDLPGVFDTLSEPHALMATPAQVDGAGNANLSGIGDYAHPKVAFGGTRGLPDARTLHFVLPAHSARQLVRRVDFVSTCAATRERPALLFTELCVMRWHAPAGQWRLEAVAPGADASAVRTQTGFDFVEAEAVATLEDPPSEALALLGSIDPFGLRQLDFVKDRNAQLDEFARIYEREAELVGRHVVPRTRT